MLTLSEVWLDFPQLEALLFTMGEEGLIWSTPMCCCCLIRWLLCLNMVLKLQCAYVCSVSTSSCGGEEVLYCESGEVLEQLPIAAVDAPVHPWRCSRPGWMGPWVTWSSIKCGGWWPCLWRGGLEIYDPWGPSQPGPFYGSVTISLHQVGDPREVNCKENQVSCGSRSKTYVLLTADFDYFFFWDGWSSSRITLLACVWLHPDPLLQSKFINHTHFIILFISWASRSIVQAHRNIIQIFSSFHFSSYHKNGLPWKELIQRIVDSARMDES